MNPNFLHRAVELSRRGMEAGQGGPFGAVIARGDRIIAEAYNTVLATKDPTNHAEIVAIRSAARVLGTVDLTGCELYVNAQPCPMCAGAVYWARLERVYFANTAAESARIGFDDVRIDTELNRNPQDRGIPFEHVPDRRAREVFDDWLRMEGRVEY
ncbi:cytidine and deoxycytidylate deaminase zinc-binding region [Corynebacterium efficiens YS-314]|nr:nucleoside deaminase [Corynebacterium efficiens]EEW50598.1 cytidine and deoxycytidylate deaminase zinc-binding region [Corynebacterium efficiens YS-314]